MHTYLFDFDGTLVDSMPVYASMMLGILREHGVAHDESVIKITPCFRCFEYNFFSGKINGGFSKILTKFI